MRAPAGDACMVVPFDNSAHIGDARAVARSQARSSPYPKETRLAPPEAPAAGPRATRVLGDLTQERATRGMGLAALAFVAFLPVDLFVRASLFPEIPVAEPLAARLGGAGLFAAAWLFLRARPLHTTALVVVASAFVTIALVPIALLAIQFGGLESGYIYTPAFCALAMSTFLPLPWRRGALATLFGGAAFCATLIAGVALSPRLAPQLSSPHSLAVFVEYWAHVFGMTVFAVLGGHYVHASRARLIDARRLGRYLLKRQLGHGGMNDVWLAWDFPLKRDVALKLLHAREPGDARRTRFEREARATSRLHSPHTVRIFDFGSNDEGTAWIAMEYLHGQDIDRLVAARGPLDPRRAVHFARQAAASLAEAHAAGLVHRDIKPANLMVLSRPGEADFLKVLDFGIAHETDTNQTKLTGTGHIVGTPAFMAPEIWAGLPADPRSDVWSFGATLYVMLTGQLPFGSSVMQAIGPLTPPSACRGAALPEGLDALVEIGRAHV